MDIREAERLLAGRSKPSSTLASKDWELAAILSKGQVYPGCFPAILLGKQKKKKEVLHVCFCYCAPEESLGHHLAKRQNPSYLYLTPPEGNTSFSFYFTFLKDFFFFLLNVGHTKTRKDVSLDSQVENPSRKPVPCQEQNEEECINFKLT